MVVMSGGNAPLSLGGGSSGGGGGSGAVVGGVGAGGGVGASSGGAQEKLPTMFIERPKMPRATWDALRQHILRERQKKKHEQEQTQEVRDTSSVAKMCPRSTSSAEKLSCFDFKLHGRRCGVVKRRRTRSISHSY